MKKKGKKRKTRKSIHICNKHTETLTRKQTNLTNPGSVASYDHPAIPVRESAGLGVYGARSIADFHTPRLKIILLGLGLREQWF